MLIEAGLEISAGFLEGEVTACPLVIELGTFSWGQYETSSVKKRVLVSLARCRALERDKIDGAKFWRVTSRDDEIRYF